MIRKIHFATIFKNLLWFSEYLFESSTFKSLSIFIIYCEGIFVEVVLILKSGITGEENFYGRECFLNFS